ncbi:hypothetical protein N206_05775 [Helicobacter pylori UM111]|nr:hypothetical protein N206_05775 [Helicobacter pylori UM111]
MFFHKVFLEVIFCCKNILNSNRFTIGLILPLNLLDFKKKKKILGYFNLFIFGALIFVTIKLSFEFYHQYLMGIKPN